MAGKIGKFVAATASASLICDTTLQAMTGDSVVVECAEPSMPAAEMIEGLGDPAAFQDLVSGILDPSDANGREVSLDSVKPPLEFASEDRDPEGRGRRAPDPPYPCGR